MKKASSKILRFNQKALFVLISILLGAVSAQGQAILSGDRSVPVEARNGMVVTSHTLATEVALEVLKKGGNAIDAAVTAGFALAVTQPRSGNIGGGEHIHHKLQLWLRHRSGGGAVFFLLTKWMTFLQNLEFRICMG